jgi:hypothetical protein
LGKIAVFSAFEATALISICLLFKRRSRLLHALALTVFVAWSLFSSVNRLFCTYYGDLIHPSRIGDVRYLPDIARQLIHQIVDPWFLVQLGILGACLGVIHWGFRSREIPRRMIAVTLAAVFAANAALVGLQVFRRGSLTANRQSFGLLQSVYLYGAAPVYLEATFDVLLGKPKERVPVPFPGTVNAGLGEIGDLRGVGIGLDHAFILQVESLDVKALEYVDPNGNALMPFTRSLSERSHFHTRFWAHHSGGGSSSAELATLLSLVPITSHNGFLTGNYDEIEALNHVLKRAGFESFFFHANRGNFFGRNTAYERLEFDHFCDARCFEGDAEGWYSRDRAFFEQSVGLLRERRGPGSRIFAYFVTMQSHGPFRNYDDATSEELAAELSSFAGSSRLRRDYMCSMREVDRAIETFFASIRAAGLDDALVVLFADHTSGVMNGVENRSERVPLLIHYPGVEPRRLDAVGSLLDVAPTIAQLLGLDPGATWIGDTLYQGDGRVVIFADGTVLRGTPDRLERSRANEQQRRFLEYSRYLQW